MKRNQIVLVIAIVFGLAGAMTLAAADHAFVGADKCKMCHKVEFASWEQTSHAKSLDMAKASKDPAYCADCLKCHATNADENLPGVQCEACHGPGADYKKMSIMKDQAAAIANGLIIPSQATCDACHVGDDHASKKSFDAEKGNEKAIHAKKQG